MKTISTKHILLNYHNQILHMEKIGSLLIAINQTWIKYFKDKNEQTVGAVMGELYAIDQDWFENDGKVYAIKEGKKVFKEGKLEADYNKLIADKLSEPCTLHLL